MGPLELIAFAQRNKALTSNGVPDSSLAVPGKLCINTLTGDLYKCAVAGTWIMQTGGGGGGEPESYIKSALVSGNTLTLTNQDDSTVSFTPEETEIDDTLSQTGQAADAKAAGDRIAQLEYAVFHAENWELIQTLVRAGMGEIAYPVGTQFIVPHEIYGELVFDVVAHDHHAKTDDEEAHTMTLLMHNTLPGKPYDAPEALYYVSADVWPSGMPAGDYYFEIPDEYSAAFPDWTGLGFTTTESIPVGGHICIDWTSAGTSSMRISTYSSADSRNRIEPQITPTSSTAGTNLGALSLKGDEFDGKINYLYVARRGLPNWAQSNIRQWANSTDAIFNWIPQNVFDRLGSVYANAAGFAHGFSADFLAALVNVKITTFTNVIFGTIPAGGAKLEETEDKFFLPSFTEIFGIPQNGISDGAGLEYYEGAAAAQYVKYLYNSTTTATKYELRSGVYNYVQNIINISVAGAKDSNYPLDQTNIAFACVIG